MKFLYRLPFGPVLPYPRQDEGAVVGLDPQQFVVLQLQEDSKPQINEETEYLEPIETITIGDPEGVLHRSWRKLSIRPKPQWALFADALYANSGAKAAMAAADQLLAVRLGSSLAAAKSELPDDIESFGLAWDDALAQGLISEELAAGFLQLAQRFNLPAAFIARLQRHP